MVTIRDISTVREPAALATGEIVGGSPATFGTYHDHWQGNYLLEQMNDDICIDDWEETEAAPEITEAQAAGTPETSVILAGSPDTYGTYLSQWAGNYRPAIRVVACGTGFIGVYIEAPRLLIDAGGTGGASGVTARRASIH